MQVVIGDIHGCLDELQRLLALVGATPDDTVVSVGDVVDRGPESPEVVRFLRERPNTLVLAGNHERKHIRGIFSYAQEITRLQFGESYADAVDWMRSLPYFLELEHAIVVHAALAPDVPLAEQHDEILCGSTSGEKDLAARFPANTWHDHYRGPKPVVFGHHVVDAPLLRDNLVYGIDTGACHGGHLTALTLPDFRLHSVPARENHWARTKRTWQADVLAAKPWATMLWADLDEQLARFGRLEEQRTRDYVERLRAWRTAVDARIDEVLAAVAREASGLDDTTARQHPLSKFIFQTLRKRLDRAAFLKQVQTPHKLDELALALGLQKLPPPSARDGS